MTAVPCKQCGMSPRNSVHNNPSQFGYHAWEEKPEDTSKEDLREELVNLVHEEVYKNPVGEDINCYLIVDLILSRLGLA